MKSLAFLERSARRASGSPRTTALHHRQRGAYQEE